MAKYMYHYTSVGNLEKIIDSRNLRLTESNITNMIKNPNYWDVEAYNRWELKLYKPVVWLTDMEKPDTEALAIYSDIVDKSEIKITIKKQPYFKPWLEWSRKQGIDKDWANVIEKDRKPKKWWVSEMPIKAVDFIKVENLKTGEVYIDKEKNFYKDGYEISEEKETYPIIKFIKGLTRKYPTVWEQIDKAVEMSRNNPSLAEKFRRCYVPETAVEAYVKGQYSKIVNYSEIKADTAAITVLAAWRRYKQVYRFDEYLKNMLFLQAESFEDMIKIPTQVLSNMPYDSFYVDCELDFGKPFKDKIIGFFVSFDNLIVDNKGLKLCLRLSFIIENGLFIYNPMFVLDAENNLLEYVETHANNSIESICKASNLDINEMKEQYLGNITEGFKSTILKALQLVLYICAKNAEVSENREQAKVYRPSTAGVLRDSNSEIRKWDIGIKTGQAIKMFDIKQEQNDCIIAVDYTDEERVGKSKRPHTRRGHWHHYWTGSRSEPEQKN